jgi:hypothetical protein
MQARMAGELQQQLAAAEAAKEQTMTELAASRDAEQALSARVAEAQAAAADLAVQAEQEAAVAGDSARLEEAQACGPATPRARNCTFHAASEGGWRASSHPKLRAKKGVQRRRTRFPKWTDFLQQNDQGGFVVDRLCLSHEVHEGSKKSAGQRCRPTDVSEFLEQLIGGG